MVESSIPTFEAFCIHHDPTSLLADQAYLRQYLSIVQQYASLASTRAFPEKLEPSKPLALRWRNAGLKAIKSIASSEALSSATTEQYDVAVPMILENLWTDNEDFLDVLHQRAEVEEKLGGALLRRRTSVATVQTADTESNMNPIALADTAVDMDKLAEEDTGVLAMECLRQIFIAPNRSQAHAATVALLAFIQERVSQQEEVVRTDFNGRDSGWAIKMFLLVARWAPVADRFTILTTAMDTLTQHPLTDDTLRQHIVLAAMVGALLRSDINLIGLSVMDVLLQFIAHIRRLVQMPGDPNSMRSEAPLPGQPDPRSPTTTQLAEKADRAASERKDLLIRLQECIGDLATHVYYADQISDMISTILVKLKPSRSSSISQSPHGEKADGTPKSSTQALADDHHVDSLFALTVAKIAALRAIKSVLLVANPRTKMSGNLSLSRSRVPIQVWEGTQWLLSDPDGLVRKAYADAVVTWLDRETTKADRKARDETSRPILKNRELPAATLARRVVSSASTREKPVKAPPSHFLQLLHLAIYDNAIQFIDYETDIVLLHVLLAKLVNKLGVNAVRYGLPMVFRLQEDIQDAETPIQKVRLGSLVHGYFWVLTEEFDFEGSFVGRAVHSEIIRRRSKHFWVEGISVPAPRVELVGTPGIVRPQPRLPLKEIESEALLPFDERLALVECICEGYQLQSMAPSTSPAASPGRSFTSPMLGSTMSTIPTIETEQEIPLAFREQMLTEWCREAALAAVQTSSKSASLNGSRSTNRLHANGNGHHLRPDRSSPAGSRTNLRPHSAGADGAALRTSKHRKTSLRSEHSPAPQPPHAYNADTSITREQVTSVEQLKLVLSGQLQPPPTMHGPGGHQHSRSGFQLDDSSSDSVASYDMTPSELSFNPAMADSVSTTADGGAAATTTRIAGRRSVSRERGERKSSLPGGPLSSHPPSASSPEALANSGGIGERDGVENKDEDDDEAVPPVPPIPSSLVVGIVSGGKTVTQDFAPIPNSAAPRPGTASKRSLKSRDSTRLVGSSAGERSASADGRGGDGRNGTGLRHGHGHGHGTTRPVMDLNALLRGIDTSRDTKLEDEGGVARPPY
jgi:hypothetical protein